jgi:hypothetical protein
MTAARKERERVLTASSQISAFCVIEEGTVNARVSRAAKKPPARAQESTRGHLSAEGRERISRAMKKRWAQAKRKGMNAATGRPFE